ncbi:MAG: adenine deaminase [Syntrophorhabdaceae bacterium]|nr:adenine deaminase [Syntrophorhabdaceae bacterium]
MRVSGNIVDILNNEVYPGTIEIKDRAIKGIFRESSRYNTYILPGFIDAHCHIESSMLCPSEFARIATVHGTIATVSDPHEIANVLGIDGVYFMIDNGRQVPFKFHFGAPSCVPATDFETTGAKIDISALETLLKNPEIKYLSEMMNFPGVINHDPQVMDKITLAKRFKKPIDGHAPGLRGDALKRYIEAGITTDHETFGYDEAEEKINLGMKVIIREGSAAKNFDTLSTLISKYPHNCMFCSDDKHPDDLVEGHINSLVKRAVLSGIDLMKVLWCACVNPVFHYGLEVGLLRDSDPADFIEVDSLQDFNILRTYINGRVVAEEGSPLIEHIPARHINRFGTQIKSPLDFILYGNQDKKTNIIEAIDGQIITGWSKTTLRPTDGCFKADRERDILKIAVINRYSNERPAMAFIKNFGLKKGAIASSIAHDSHNIVVVGTDDEDICSAVNLIIEKKGGLAVAVGNIQMVMPLPVAGLMSDGDGYEVARTYKNLDRLAKQIGTSLNSPFMTLSFMSLPVIPRLKITDRGLFDVDRFRFIDLFA